MNIKKYTKDYEKLANSFSCGNTVIDNFLHDGSALDVNRGITYIMLSDEEDFIIGYYNIENGRVDRIDTVDNQDIYELMGGSININYLAVHSSFQRKLVAQNGNNKIYLGDLLLHDCEERILQLRNQTGISFVTVCSTNEGYHLYHVRNGFEDFEDDMNTVIQENELNCHKLYKVVDDIIGA
ncbi:MAG: N-acetyltransferase [Lachnospiraceae bacterium]|nr:N-acetyltransferase [Lachnospiraceae bacterium]